MQNDISEEIEEGREPKNLKQLYEWIILDPLSYFNFEKSRTNKNRLNDFTFLWLPIIINLFIVSVCTLVISSIIYLSTNYNYKTPNVFLFPPLASIGIYIFSQIYFLINRKPMYAILFIVESISMSIIFLFLYTPFQNIIYFSKGNQVENIFYSLGFAIHLIIWYFLRKRRNFQRIQVIITISLVGFYLLDFEFSHFNTFVEGTILGFCTSIFFYSKISFKFIYYRVKHFFIPYTIGNNPYLWDKSLDIIIPTIDESLHEIIYKNAEEEKTIFFLDKVVTRAGMYSEIKNPYKNNIIKNSMKFYIIFKAGLLYKKRFDSWESIEVIHFINSNKKGDFSFLPSNEWAESLKPIQDNLSSYRNENALHNREKYLKALKDAVEKFEIRNLIEQKDWTKYYQRTINVWKKTLKEEEEKLDLELETEQPLGANIYRTGIPLSEEDKSVFFGRDELRQRLKNNILNAQQMPLFFINGQRRTGKSSLISFLPEYLDTGFLVVKYDMQAYAPTSIGQFLETLINATSKMFGEEEMTLNSDLLWVENWKIIKDKLDDLAGKNRKKIILAIDEYELLHKLLQKDTEQAENFLGAIRGYVQAQKDVIFLFAGADKMTELKNPNWNEFFTQKETLKVEYLNEEDTNKLIDAYPSLTYDNEVRKEIFRLTQGYPAMLQILLHKIVENANITKEIHIEDKQLQKALEDTFYQVDNNVIDIFWSQFCKNRNLRPTVLQILNKEKPTNKKALFQLTQHGFVIENNGVASLRVPLFEKWLHDYADKVD